MGPGTNSHEAQSEPLLSSQPAEVTATVAAASGVADNSGKWRESYAGPVIIALAIILGTVGGFIYVIPEMGHESLRLTWYSVAGVLALSSLLFLAAVNQADPGVVPPLPDEDPDVTYANRHRAALEAQIRGRERDLAALAVRDYGGSSNGRARRGRTTPSATLYPADTVIGLSLDPRGQWTRWRRREVGQGVNVDDDLDENEFELERYCSSCHLWRTAGVSHCSTCGYCMERYDHHCGVIGNCVARGNHCFFLLFLWSVSLLSIWMAAAAIITVRRLTDQTLHPGASLWSRWDNYVIVLLTVVYVYCSLVILFAALHCSFILCGTTTKAYAHQPSYFPCCFKGGPSMCNKRSWNTWSDVATCGGKWFAWKYRVHPATPSESCAVTV
eukprot:jgi/Mesvir1/9854/Mv22390-RA.1